MLNIKAFLCLFVVKNNKNGKISLLEKVTYDKMIKVLSEVTIFMEKKRHKRKNNHVVIVTSDAVNADVKQYRIKPWVLQTIIFFLCVIIGAMIGYIIYEKDIWEASVKQTLAWQDEADRKEQEKEELLQAMVEQQKQYDEQAAALNGVIDDKNQEIDELQHSIDGLEEQIKILSDTLAKKIQNEEALQERLNGYFLPTGFPLTGAATIEEATDENPMCIFKANATGALVVATAEGTVIAVNADAEYGQNVWIDHGNGYVTIYRNQGEIKVKQGQTVTCGTTLFIMGKEDTQLGYQMMKDGVYINPIDMLAING